MADEREKDASELSDEALDSVAGGKRVWYTPEDPPVIGIPGDPIVIDPILIDPIVDYPPLGDTTP